MSRYAGFWQSRVPIWVVPAVILLLAAGIWVGISGLRVVQTGHYRDRGDAYSEYIVRNTVFNNVVGHDHQGGSLIWTKGYDSTNHIDDDHRLDYFPDRIVRYHSNRGAQQIPYTAMARAMGGAFTAHPDRLFELFRYLNCVCLVGCLAVFFCAVLGRRPAALAATAAMSISAGVALFGANLYFMYWLMFTPLLASPLLFGGRTKAYAAAAFVGSLAYFSTRYEFATTAALMWLLPVVLARHDRFRDMLVLGALVFCAAVAGFAVAIVTHLLTVASIERTDLAGASALVFEKLRMRVSSFTAVPRPLTIGFLKDILFRWGEGAFAVKDVFSASGALVLATGAWLCVVDRSMVWRLLVAWALATYGSWYVFGYQHIMQHFPYDAMLFSCTVALIVVLRLSAGRVGLARVGAWRGGGAGAEMARNC